MADLPNLPNPIKPAADVAKGMKGSFKRLAAFAKKRPAIVALMVGAVVLVVWAIRRRGGLGTGATRAAEEDPLLELGAEGDLGGLVPGAYPAPVPYYEPFPSYEPTPYYNPYPTYQEEVAYGTQAGTSKTYSPGVLRLERVAQEAKRDPTISGPIGYGYGLSSWWSAKKVGSTAGTKSSEIQYGAPTKTSQIQYGALRDLAGLRATAPTVRKLTTTGGRRVFSSIRQRAAEVVPRLAPKPTGTQVPRPGQIPRE